VIELADVVAEIIGSTAAFVLKVITGRTKFLYYYVAYAFI
jgi:hypothetical protein